MKRGHGACAATGQSNCKTTGWDQPPRVSSCGQAGLCPQSITIRASRRCQSCVATPYEPICLKLRRLASRRLAAALTEGSRTAPHVRIDAAPRMLVVSWMAGIISLFIIDLLEGIMTVGMPRRTPAPGLRSAVLVCTPPALRKELVGRCRVLGSASSATDGRETPQLRSASRCRGPSLAKTSLTEVKTWRRCAKVSPGGARQEIVTKATLRLRGASPRRVASPALHRKRSPFDV
jgi:hypothetical protein